MAGEKWLHSFEELIEVFFSLRQVWMPRAEVSGKSKKVALRCRADGSSSVQISLATVCYVEQFALLCQILLDAPLKIRDHERSAGPGNYLVVMDASHSRVVVKTK